MKVGGSVHHIPTASDLETLISVRRRGCVAIYLPTSPITAEAADADRIELKNLAKEAVAQLEAGQTDQGRYESLAAQERTSDDLATVARAATFGAVATLFADIDETVPGAIDEQTGEVTVDDADDAINYGVVDEIARRTCSRAVACSRSAATTCRRRDRWRRFFATPSEPPRLETRIGLRPCRSRSGT